MEPSTSDLASLLSRIDELERRIRNGRRFSAALVGALALAAALAKAPRDASQVEYAANGLAAPAIAAGDTNAGSRYSRPVTVVKTWDAASLAEPGAQEGILCQQTWTGDTRLPLTRSGVFAVNRYGAGGSGGGSAGTSIAVGGYSEHRGDGALTGPVYGAELATTMYEAGSIQYAFGAMGMAQIANASRPATLVRGVGISGAARVLPGATGSMDAAVGVNGSASMDGAGSIKTAMAGHFEVARTGTGTVDTAYGVRIEGVSAGARDNYGLRIAGASGGTGDNVALQVDSGEARFRGNLNLFGSGGDARVRLVFDVAGQDGTIAYDPEGAAFSLDRPLSVSGTAASIASGTGSPEGAVRAAPGSIYLRVDGGPASTLWIKERGDGVTGWRAK